MKQVLIPYHLMDKKQDSSRKAAEFQQNVDQLMTMVNKRRTNNEKI